MNCSATVHRCTPLYMMAATMHGIKWTTGSGWQNNGATAVPYANTLLRKGFLFTRSATPATLPPGELHP